MRGPSLTCCRGCQKRTEFVDSWPAIPSFLQHSRRDLLTAISWLLTPLPLLFFYRRRNGHEWIAVGPLQTAGGSLMITAVRSFGKDAVNPWTFHELRVFAWSWKRRQEKEKRLFDPTSNTRQLYASLSKDYNSSWAAIRYLEPQPAVKEEAFRRGTTLSGRVLQWGTSLVFSFYHRLFLFVTTRL